MINYQNNLNKYFVKEILYMKYKIYILSLILLISTNFLEARKIKLKKKATTTNTISTFGDINFEMELLSFQNSSNNQDKTNKYYGWETNINIIPSGDMRAVKGGTFTMLGGSELDS